MVGELSFLVLMVAATIWNPPAGLTVFVVPFMATRVLLMTGNWAQHAFVDHEDCTNDYRTVVSFMNSVYNRRGFNDGYHLTHHLKPSLHYLDMPGDFVSRREEMVRMDSLVFRKIDYFEIFLMLMESATPSWPATTCSWIPSTPRARMRSLRSSGDACSASSRMNWLCWPRAPETPSAAREQEMVLYLLESLNTTVALSLTSTPHDTHQ